MLQIFKYSLIQNYYRLIYYYIFMSEEDTSSALLSSRSNQHTIYPTLFQFAKNNNKADQLYMLAGTVAAIAAGVASPFFMIFFSTISQIFIPGNESTAVEQGADLFVKLFIVGLFTWVSHALSMWSWNKSGSRLAIRIKKLYYQQILKQQVQWFDSYQTSKIASELSQNTLVIETALGEKISFAITALTTSIFGFIFSFVKCWQMSLYLAAFLPLMLLSGYLMIKFMSMKALASKLSYESASAVAETAFGAIRSVKILTGEKFECRKFSQALRSSEPKLIRHLLLSSLSSGLMNLIMMGLYAFGFFIGKDMLINKTGDSSSSDIISTFFCFMVAGQSIGQISPIFKNAVDAHQAYVKIFHLVSREKGLSENQNGITIDKIQIIEIRNLSFFYTESNKQSLEHNYNKIILKDFNLKLKRGKMIAVIGPSGCGKSTLSQLLLYFYGASSGNIQVNGVKLDKLNTKQYRRKIGYVSQQPILFSTSIKQNIRFSNPSIKDEQIIQILKQCKAWSFVKELEDGINTYVGAKGSQLSGGQKQRIAIARALAKKPEVLILDQATSALDVESQKDILNMLNKYKKQIIILFITHRLSTIKEADDIVILKDGVIVEQGSHQQLLQSSSVYNQLMKNEQQDGRKQSCEQAHLQNSQKINLPQTKQIISTNIQENNQKKQQGIFKIWKEKQIYYELLVKSESLRKYLLVGSMFAVLNGLAYPFFNATFSSVMGLMGNADLNSSQINKYCLYFLIVAILAAISNFTHSYAFGIYGQKIVLGLRIQVFEKMLKFPCSFFDKRQNSPGSLSTKLSQDSYQLHNFLTGILSVVCLNMSIIVASLSFAFYFSWKLTLILLVFSPLMAAKGAIAASVLKRMSKKADQIEVSIGSFVSDTITNIKTVKSFGGYQQFLSVFNKNADQAQGLKSIKFLKLGILQGFSKSSAIFVYAIMFWIAAAFFANYQFSDPKDALIAIFCIIFSASTVGQNSQYMPDLMKTEKATKNILDTIKTEDEFQITKRNQDLSLRHHKIQGRIQFKNVCFKYPQRNQQVLNEFNLVIKPGQKVAIVGESGSGKSSLILILARLYPIQSGDILLDGIQIQRYPLKKYRKQLGILSQEPTVFAGSIQSNILYQFQSKEKYNKRMKNYCQLSAVNQIIEKYEKSKLKQVGSGNQISGGEKQRVSLARCFIRKPKLYLLDQPTSALDSNTETKIFNNIMPQIGNKTLIFTTHRLNIVKYADTIVVMKKGRLMQQGHYDQLIKRKQYLYKLVNVKQDLNLMIITVD